MKKLMLLIVVIITIIGTGFASSILVNTPNGGEKLTLGDNYTVRWNGSGLKNKVKLTLWRNNAFVGLIVKNMPHSGSYSWKAGYYKNGVASVGTGYKIKIREQGGKNYQTQDSSNNSFSIITKVVSKPYIKVIKPSGGNFIKGVNKILIKWQDQNLKNNIFVTINKYDNSWKTAIGYNNFKPKLMQGMEVSIPANVKAGKYYILVKSGDVYGKSAFFTVSEKSSSNTEVIRINPQGVQTRIIAPQYSIKQQQKYLQLKKEANIQAYGKLVASTDLADFGSTVDIKISFKNAIKVKVYDKNTNKEIYKWSRKKPDGNMVTRSIRLDRVDTAIEMEVLGTKDSYYANCFITARPIVNEFRIEDTTMYKVVHYSFSGCEYAYLKKFDTNKNTWVRVYKLVGDGYVNKGLFPKKGKIKLVVASLKKTRYALVLIGELKQGVVKSREIVKNFWTDQYIK